MIPQSGLYTGTLRHRRFEPRRHEFHYKLFLAFLDIDQIPELMEATPWTSYNRFHWASYQENDHFGDPRMALRERVTRDASVQGIILTGGPIFLLTHLRYLGYCFNPISFFYCYDRTGKLEAILAEVNNTFGESRNYWLSPRNQESSENSLRFRCAKTLHVSPFMDMNLDYEFVLTEPGEKLVAHMNTVESGGGKTAHALLDATLALEREPWDAWSVGRALVRHPWMTAKVIGAIHWQALLLLLKRVPVFTHPDRIRPAVEEAAKRT